MEEKDEEFEFPDQVQYKTLLLTRFTFSADQLYYFMMDYKWKSNKYEVKIQKLEESPIPTFKMQQQCSWFNYL